jgi:endo-1,4-beta-xylanase
MFGHHRLTRRSALRGAATAAAGLVGLPRRGFAQDATPQASPIALSPVPLWQTAWERGLVFGTSMATWQLGDPEMVQLIDHEAAILFTEDDLLWWRLKPTPDAPLDFQYGDAFFNFAEQHRQLVFATHLVWDEGFGEGWTEDDIWGLDEASARALLMDTLEQQVTRYKGRVAGWIVVNEVVDAHEADGLRTDYPWTQTIGKSVVADAFTATAAIDPDATLVLNEFGFETDSEFDAAADKRAKALIVIDDLLNAGVPVHALGVQAHLSADGFTEKFNTDAYRQFLADVAGRGLKILITEMDVLDDGLPADTAPRDQAVADAYGRYLDVALQEPAVASLMVFGLSDRYTWLQEDYPRDDGAPRRPLVFDDAMTPKPAYDAVQAALERAPSRTPLWTPPRAS